MLHHHVGETGDGRPARGASPRRHGRGDAGAGGRGPRRSAPRSAPRRRWPASSLRAARSPGSRWPTATEIDAADGRSPPRTRRSRSCTWSTGPNCRPTSSPTSSAGTAGQRHRQGQPGAGPAADVRQPPRVRPAGLRRHDRAGRVARRHRDRVPGGRRRASRAPLPFADICIPSVFDDSLAPEGKHVDGDVHPVGAAHAGPTQPHRDELEAYADRVIARMEAVAPGFTDSVLHRQVIGPHEMRARVRADRRQHLPRRAVRWGRCSTRRPAAGYADLRTPVRGLYQAGSATHGGGGVTGIPGRNVVRQVLADRKAAKRRSALAPAESRVSTVSRAAACAGPPPLRQPRELGRRALDRCCCPSGPASAGWTTSARGAGHRDPAAEPARRHRPAR